MKKRIVILLVGILAFASCKKENIPTPTSTSDSITGVRIRYMVMVVGAENSIGKSESYLENATVAVVVDGEVLKIEVDSSGYAVFDYLFAGNTVVKVQCPGYTTANMVVDLRAMSDSTNIYDSSNRRVVSNIVTLFPTVGDGTATISGNLYADLDLTILGLESVNEDIKVRASISPEQLADYIDHSGAGGILDLVYEGILFTTDVESGNYSIIVPSSTKGLYIALSSDNFAYDQQLTPTDVERKIFELISDTVVVQPGANIVKDLFFE